MINTGISPILFTYFKHRTYCCLSKTSFTLNSSHFVVCRPIICTIKNSTIDIFTQQNTRASYASISAAQYWKNVRYAINVLNVVMAICLTINTKILKFRVLMPFCFRCAANVEPRQWADTGKRESIFLSQQHNFTERKAHQLLLCMLTCTRLKPLVTNHSHSLASPLVVAI